MASDEDNQVYIDAQFYQSKNSLKNSHPLLYHPPHPAIIKFSAKGRIEHRYNLPINHHNQFLLLHIITERNTANFTG